MIRLSRLERKVTLVTDQPLLITVGTISKPHNLKGNVIVFPLTDFPERLLEMKEVLVEKEGKTNLMSIEKATLYKRFLNIKFLGVDTIEYAEQLRGALLKITQEQLKPLGKDQYYIFQLIGLKVKKVDGQLLGQLTDVLKTGANDVYVIKDGSGKELLLPALKSVVKKIDLECMEMQVELLPGMEN